MHEHGFLMDKVEEKVLKYNTQLRELGWGPLVKLTCDYTKDWVRVLYAMIPTVK